VAEAVYHHTFPNGLTLLAERMDHVRSATLYFLVPAGCAYDPPDQAGLGAVLAEMMTRGAGERDSEQLSLALDNLGVDRGESVGLLNMWFYGSTLARNLPTVLDLYADIIRRPRLPEEDLPAAQALALQDIQGLEDSPQDKVMVELRKRYYPAPLNRDKNGTAAGVQAVTPQSLRAQYQRLFRPNGAILAVAGNIDWPQLRDQAERNFADWPRGDDLTLPIGPHAPTSDHVAKETQQTQIAMAFPSVTMTSADYFAARGAVGVLSSGMSSRLFTEVREKRGLCYSVYATHETLKDRGSVLAYAGTRADRAQETLDVMLGEFRRLREGIEHDELDRVKAGLKTALIMQQESTAARAGSIARDWYYLGRIRTFDEIQEAIDRLSTRAILDHLDRYPFVEPTVVTLGPSPLTVRKD
jgi:predicted Zn-dependent peptidase